MFDIIPINQSCPTHSHFLLHFCRELIDCLWDKDRFIQALVYCSLHHCLNPQLLHQCWHCAAIFKRVWMAGCQRASTKGHILFQWETALYQQDLFGSTMFPWWVLQYLMLRCCCSCSAVLWDLIPFVNLLWWLVSLPLMLKEMGVWAHETIYIMAKTWWWGWERGSELTWCMHRMCVFWYWCGICVFTSMSRLVALILDGPMDADLPALCVFWLSPVCLDPSWAFFLANVAAGW